MQQYMMKEITGKLFNELIGEKKIYKILDNTDFKTQKVGIISS